MRDRFSKSVAGSEICFLLFLALALADGSRAQTGSTSSNHEGAVSDALAYLNRVVASYAQVSSYHIEMIEETQLNGELYRSWSKIFTTAVVGSNNRYRFEIRSGTGSGLQVSDGKTEWTYFPPFQQYTQQPNPSAGPSRVHSQAASGLFELAASQRAVSWIPQLLKSVRTAKYGPEESLNVNGASIACTVVKAEGELPRISVHITTSFTFWIDKETDLIRKITERTEGPLFPQRPDVNYQSERDMVYTVVELNTISFPDGVFTFNPPTTAALVKEFEDPQSARMREFVGKQAPAVSFKTADGKEISLQSFQGKIVLLDFWATWCAPCVASLPAIEKLYQETSEKGVALLSLDEEEEPRKATEFWTAHKEPWPNYHASDEIVKQFPEHGIPYFVLIDAAGKVVFSHAGLDESGLRSALGKLVPGLAATH